MSTRKAASEPEDDWPASEDDGPAPEDDWPASEDDGPASEDDSPAAEDDSPASEDDWPGMVIVDEKDLVWDEKLGYHRCPLGLTQTPRAIVGCREWTKDGTGLKLYVQQLEREGICDVVVVDEDEQEICIRAVTCARDHERAKYPDIIIMHHKWYGLPPLNGRSLIDAETNKEVWVERFGDAVHASEFGWSGDPDGCADPGDGGVNGSGSWRIGDLDIPF